MRVLFAAMALMASGMNAWAQLLPVEAFTRDPGIMMPAISPAGDKIAFISSSEGQPVVVVFDIATRQTLAADISRIRPEGLRWASDTHVVLVAGDVDSVFGIRGRVDVAAAIVLDVEDDLSSQQLLRRGENLGRNISVGRVVGIDWEGGNILIPAFDTTGSYSLYAVRPDNGFGNLIARGDRRSIDWILDENAEPLIRVDYNNETNSQRVVLFEDGSFRELDQVRNRLGLAYTPHGALPSGELVASSTIPGINGNRQTLFRLDETTGQLTTPIFANQDFDIDRVVRDPYSNQVVGVRYIGDSFEQTHWFDANLAAAQGRLDGLLSSAGVIPRIVSWSRDRGRLIFAYETGALPTTYMMFDMATGSSTMMGSTYPELFESDSLPNRQLIAYTARDGTQIPAYITRPAGAAPFPAVMLPHGGPASRDQGGYDDFAHFLASRGYLVIQPNFRGSAGYGDDWREAGHGGWGRGIMQHDLTDAVSAIVDAGLADPDRICIAGASYGGYAALAGAVFTPDLYACAVGISGVYDLEDLQQWISDRYGRNHFAIEYIGLASAGDEDARYGNVEEISPISHVDQVTVPVLLMHAENDTVVPVRQSREMRSALRREDVDVTYVEIDDGDHWMTDEHMREVVFRNLESFLAEHIGN